MNTLRKIRKNAKALSPVVASIILIAVTVAVSIAVAIWMGALSTGFMQTETVQLGTPAFDSTNNRITISVRNTGTTALSISEAQVNGATAATNQTLPLSIPANTAYGFNVTQTGLTSGNNYQIKFITSKNNPFMTTATMP